MKPQEFFMHNALCLTCNEAIVEMLWSALLPEDHQKLLTLQEPVHGNTLLHLMALHFTSDKLFKKCCSIMPAKDIPMLLTICNEAGKTILQAAFHASNIAVMDYILHLIDE